MGFFETLNPEVIFYLEVFGALVFLSVELLLCLHILLYKKNVRSAIGWMGVVLLSPVLGGLTYYFIGVNRLIRQAKKIREPFQIESHAFPSALLSDARANPFPEISFFQKMGCGVGLSDYARGNAFKVMVNGDEAFPAMLAAIETAKDSILLCSYIFDADYAGNLFLESLARAHARGVLVRVLIDDIGIRYSRKKMTRELCKKGVKAASFLPAFRKGTVRYFNMRNHRKLLLIDGKVGFFGGMNIREGNLLQRNPSHPIQDMHFSVNGPLLQPLTDVFKVDWEFTTGEKLEVPVGRRPIAESVHGYSRVVAEGPDNDEDRLRWLILAAITMAKKTLRIVTPYFLPSEEMVDALQMAALKGVRVELLVPEKSNLFWLDAGMRSYFEVLLKRGVHIFLTPPPFDHSKFFLMDDGWSLVGSANWDERSFSLNFELNVEVFDFGLNQHLSELFEKKKAIARIITHEEVKAWTIFQRIKHQSIRLFYPYL